MAMSSCRSASLGLLLLLLSAAEAAVPVPNARQLAFMDLEQTCVSTTAR